MCQCPPNSIHYLLNFWQRMVASVPYVKANEPHLLDTYTPQVTKAYITSRLEAVSRIVTEALENPFEDIGMIQQQIEQISTIARCEYEQTCDLIVKYFDQSAHAYQELLRNQPRSRVEITIQEGRLTWLVYIIGASIGGRVFLNCNDEHDAMDGELACRVLQLMNLTDARLSQVSLSYKLTSPISQNFFL